MKSNLEQFKVYLEGIEIKVNSITLEESINNFSRVSLNIPATELALDILPSTLCHIFYKYNGNYIIIFEGELTGKSFSKQDSAKVVTLSFLNISNKLTDIYKQVSSILSGAGTGRTNEIFVGINPGESYDVFQLADSYLAEAGRWPAQIFKEALESTQKSNGDLQSPLEFLFDQVQNLDASLYYKYVGRAYKFKERILAFKNSKALLSLTKESVDTFLSLRFSGLDGLSTFVQQLYMFLSFIGHKMLFLSAPLFNKKSLLVLPDTDYLTPIRCNTFFSSSTVSAGFYNNHLNEKTRLMVKMDSLLQPAQGVELPYNITPVFPYPDVQTVGEHRELTEEEKYRGIKPSIGKTEGLENIYTKIPDGLAEQLNQGISMATGQYKTDIVDIVASISNNEVNSNLRRETRKKFLDDRYSQRSFTLTVPYNPNRLCGFPGVYIDDVFPAVVGVVTSIRTTISANGAIYSNIDFSKPRLIFNYGSKEFEELDFLLNPELSDWFDENIYSIDNIGRQVYADILGDNKDKDRSSFSRYASFSGYEAELNNIKLNYNSHRNFSKYTTEILALSVKVLKARIFNKNLKQEDRDSFEFSELLRKHMTESEYWDFFINGKANIKTSTNSNALNITYLKNIDNSNKNLNPFIEVRKQKVNNYLRSIS